ncbi:MAG: carboxypeptidase regulatory-like domain-containing protein [Candidatus Binatia bacterium]
MHGVARGLFVVGWLGVSGSLAAAEYRAEPVVDGGSISGRVLAAGDIPQLPPQPVYKEHGVCGKALPDQRLMVGKGGALANAVVDVVGITAGKPIPRDRPVVFDNAKCQFVPHVAAGAVGQTVEFHNSDPFLHDAHAWLGTRTLFNIGVLPDHTARRPLTDAGLVHINCNVRHTWMHAYLFVGENPYAVVTGADGQFALDQVPPGTYTVRVWHELLGSLERPVTVEAGKTATVDFALPVTAVEPAAAP